MQKEYLDLFNALHPGGNSFEYQRAWDQDKSKFKLGVKARQIGITTTESVKRFIRCLLWTENAETPNPPVIIFCSPSARQSSRLMHYIQRVKQRYEKFSGEKVRFKKEREDWLLFENHTEIWSLPNNPRTIEGIDASQGIIDELGNFVGNEDKEVYEAMMGSLAAKEGGMTLFGRPRGRRGLFWALRDPYGEFAGQYSIHEFTWNVRAAEDKKYKKAVEEQKLRMTALSFREQYECDFIDENIVVFPYSLLDRQKRIYKLEDLEDSFSSPWPIYMGIDFAKRIDETVVTVVEHGETKTRPIFQETTKASYDKQISWISQCIDHFNPLKCIVDETSLGIPLLDFLRQKYGYKIEGVHFNPQTKEKLILTVRNLLEQGRLELPDVKELIDQLHGMEKIISESGNIKYTGKRTETDWLDDRVWSLALSVSQLGESDWSMTIATPKAIHQPNPHEIWLKDLDQEGNPI